MNNEIKVTSTHTVFSGERATRLFQAGVILGAMKLYAKTGMKANRAYTPKNMLLTAGNIVGKTYKRGQMQRAIEDLASWMLEEKKTIPVITET